MRYIDADKLIDKIFPIGLIDDGNYTINAKAVKIAIDKMPTADVVPKSEVKALKNQVNRLQKYAAKRDEKLNALLVAKTKQEVARKILAELEEARKHWDTMWKSDHYGYGGSASGYLETDVDHTIYELKKKYTEGER